MKKKIKPLFVKDSKNKITEVYLDIKTYNAIIDRIKKFNKKYKRATTKQDERS